jgi:hypothetical protein
MFFVSDTCMVPFNTNGSLDFVLVKPTKSDDPYMTNNIQQLVV